MARVPYLSVEDLPAEYRDLLARPIALNRAMANSPEALKAFNGLAGYIRHKSRLDPRLRELAILQVGWLARSPYEWSHHVKIGREAGCSDADIRAIADETAGRPSPLEPEAKLVLRAAREMTGGPGVSDETYAALEKAFGRADTIDLAVTIAFYNAVVRLLAALKIDVESDYRKYLDEHPLPK